MRLLRRYDDDRRRSITARCAGRRAMHARRARLGGAQPNRHEQRQANEKDGRIEQVSS